MTVVGKPIFDGVASCSQASRSSKTLAPSRALQMILVFETIDTKPSSNEARALNVE